MLFSPQSFKIETMNNIIIFTRGFPGSGKTTFAKLWVNESPETRVNINRDDLRALIGVQGKHGNSTQEDTVTTLAHTMITHAAQENKDIIVSDMNLKVKYVKDMISLVAPFNYEPRFEDIIVDFNELVKRNKTRPEKDKLEESVIRDLYKRFPSKMWLSMEKVVEDMKKTTTDGKNYTPFDNNPLNTPAILVDIDGTIAHIGDRSYHDYNEKVLTDTPDHTIISIVNTYYDKGYKVIIMSGRKDSCKEHTETWLHEHNVSYDYIYMRNSDDNRKDWIVKDELVREFVSPFFHIVFCLDDRNQVVNHYRDMGYKVLQVAPGDF